MSQGEAVWITGIGTANPMGNSYPESAKNFLAGRSGIRLVTEVDLSRHPSQMAGCVEQLPVPDGVEAKAFSQLCRVEQLVLWCCTQALQDAGWWDRRTDPRLGLVLGLGAEWLLFWEEKLMKSGNPPNDPRRNEESILWRVRRRLGLAGPAITVGAACASGNVALAQARQWLRKGWVDVCLAGGVDGPVTPLSLAAFGSLGALSRRNADPAAASRPFDRGRDGFVMGEGGAMFVLEKAGEARRRGTRAYGEVAGYGASSDAHHMIIPSSNPAPAIAAMRAALTDGEVNADEIGYVNAHATSTPIGDRAETGVLQAVLGDAFGRVPVSSTKSMTGHLLSGAASVNVLACLAALEHQALPPTINLDDPDPDCSVCHVRNEARPHPVCVAVSNSFGFGGSNTCVVVRKAA